MGTYPSDLTNARGTVRILGLTLLSVTVVLDGLPSLFSSRSPGQEKGEEELTAALYQQIGQLKVELDWLKKKSGQLR
ncbi:hypothetical protein KSZ_55580 [Dictyobacter formicarum]|uniref:Uncharacterized protein n=1 Tax=Dictyobacter formicarum TaxID=2778368 RepID=A0ABQ3VMU7_9CHLR|nr:hypothetical protein KSZ_55580 [Dictyobacter formicarum]